MFRPQMYLLYGLIYVMIVWWAHHNNEGDVYAVTKMHLCVRRPN